jgi:hypothetical protein
MGRKEQRKGVMLIKGHNEEKEIEFELRYLRSLSLRKRFMLMEKKSKEMKDLLHAHGHRKSSEIIKRK